MVPTSGHTPASDTPDVSQPQVYETDMGYGIYSPLVGNVYGPTPEAVAETVAAEEARQLAQMRASVLSSQADIDAALAQGKTLVLMDRGNGKVPTVHTVECHHARSQLDRAAVWDEYLTQLEGWGYAPSLPPGPLLFDRAELESSGRSVRRCKVCAPDVAERRKRAAFGGEETRPVKALSLRDHHVGMKLTLPDGTAAGVIEGVSVAVQTSTGIHYVTPDDVVTVTRLLPGAEASL